MFPRHASIVVALCLLACSEEVPAPQAQAGAAGAASLPVGASASPTSTATPGASAAAGPTSIPAVQPASAAPGTVTGAQLSAAPTAATTAAAPTASTQAAVPAPSTAAPAPVSGPPGIAVDPMTGELVFRTEPIELQPGMESYTCFASTLDQDTVVDGFQKANQPFVHHAQFVRALAPEPAGISECKEQFKLTWLPIFLAGNGASELRFDEGIGHVLPAGTQLVLQMHLLNTSEKATKQAVEIRMHKSTAANPTPVAPWAIGSSEIRIPARQAGTAQNICTMNGSVDILAVFPHMHMLGKRFAVEVGKSLDAMRPLYTRDPYDFDDQRMEKMHLTLQAGDLLRVTCDYMNPTDKEVTFGESSTEEMCFFVGFALGEAPVQADCPNLWDALFTL
jgi:hypothetical protein